MIKHRDSNPAMTCPIVQPHPTPISLSEIKAYGSHNVRIAVAVFAIISNNIWCFIFIIAFATNIKAVKIVDML
jgi:hypothetical protein